MRPYLIGLSRSDLRSSFAQHQAGQQSLLRERTCLRVDRRTFMNKKLMTEQFALNIMFSHTLESL